MGDVIPVALLVERLGSPDADVRLTAADMLGRAGELASAAAMHLVRACGDADERVREAVVAALEDLGPPPSGDVPGLAAIAAAAGPLEAYWAATLLGRLGGGAAAAVPVLTTCVESAGDIAVRERAAWALGRIGPAAAAAREQLLRVAATGEPRLKRLVDEALAAIGR